ncbi:hypothetical protein [Halobacillus halophilus]|uniref:hypothetical protein n=1 Tax=Halobacillus halophilus TaxID=1570 RepID=UPI001CD333A3|nr:hypothetical protein [Halobacillus halophilus]MCA1011336.1 hypothetical protein [Halobacillus halophilus]
MINNQTGVTGTKGAPLRKGKPHSGMDAASSRTDPEKVKQEIQEDLRNGIGAMTAREAGSMKD